MYIYGDVKINFVPLILLMSFDVNIINILIPEVTDYSITVIIIGLGKQVAPVRVPAFIGKKVLDVYCGSGQHIMVKVEVDQ